MIIRQTEKCTLWGPGVRPETIDSDKQYLVTSAIESYGFNDLQEADKKFVSLTGEKPFGSLLIKQI